MGRVPNISLWHADTLEGLHEVLTSLPMFPDMKIDVTPVIDHPVTQLADARTGVRKPD